MVYYLQCSCTHLNFHVNIDNSNSLHIFIDPPITVMVTASLNTPLMVGQTGNTLTCDVSGADNLNLMITYQWTRNDGTTSSEPVGNSSNTLPLSPLRLSHAGSYSCSITSTLLNDPGPINAANGQSVTIQSKYDYFAAMAIRTQILYTLCSNSARSTVRYCH